MLTDKAYIKHILDAIVKIETYTKGLDKTQFADRKNEMTSDAVIRQFEIIGEAAGRLSEEIKRQYPDLPWRDIYDMRNKLTHEYFGVNLAVVWKTIETDLLILKETINKIVKTIVDTET